MGRAEDLMKRLSERRAERARLGMHVGQTDGPDHELYGEVANLVGQIVAAHLLLLGTNHQNNFGRRTYEIDTPDGVRVKVDASKSYIKSRSPFWKDPATGREDDMDDVLGGHLDP